MNLMLPQREAGFHFVDESGAIAISVGELV